MFFFPLFGLASISTHTHIRAHTHAHTHSAPLGTRASQSASSLRQEQALLYDEEQLLFLARSLTGGYRLAPLSPLMTQVALCCPPPNSPPTPPHAPHHFAVSLEG